MSSFFSTCFQYLFRLFLSLPSLKSTKLAFLAELEADFDWTGCTERDTTSEWDRFSSFLESHGVFLFKTEAYLRAALPPSTPALSPFGPTRDEDFVYRLSPSTTRRKFYNHVHSLCRFAIDDLGREMYVKAVQVKSDEWRILELLTSPTLRNDPANHTIPIISILYHGQTVFLVQAKWGAEWLWPSLESMNERYAVAHQLLEGLAFMHRQGIGHGDLHADNVVWNCHDVRLSQNAPNYRKLQRNFDFCLGFIDFGASVRFPNDCLNQLIPCRSAGPSKPYRSPEQDQEEGKTFDLFAADLYGLGQILINEWKTSLDGRDDALPSAYRTLLLEMTALEPNRRPSAEAALARLNSMMETQV